MARKLSPRTLLHRVLSSAPVPVYVVDEQRQIVFCNPACGAWAGFDERQMLGQRCEYHSAAARQPIEELAAFLCPPPEAFLGQAARAEMRLPGQAPELARWAEFLPLGPAGTQPVSVLAWVGWPQRPSESGPLGGWREAESDQLHARLRALREAERERHLAQQTLGQTPVMQRVREQMRIAVQAGARVLLVGPAGTGKEQVARSIHHARDLADGPLLPLDCCLLDAEQLESTIAAFARHVAAFEAARSGTLLLLNVDQLSSQAQATLLAVLSPREIGLRVLATSSVGLEELCAAGQFLTELAYALSTLVIELPPLDRRREDIPLLAQMFVERHNAEGGRQLSGLSSEALDVLSACDWPGNVDELAAAVERACRAARGPWVAVDDLPEDVRLAPQAAARQPRPVESIELDGYLARVETELFRRALRQAKGNKTKAAQLLGLNRARFHRRLQQLGLDG